MAESIKPASAGFPRYRVLTVTEIDRLVYRRLEKSGVAKPKPGRAGEYIISDKSKAQSSVVMPQVMNGLGRDGWVLEAVNKMECYIFRQDALPVPVEYKVLSPAEIDRLSVVDLEQQGVLRLHHFEGTTPAMEIVDAEGAKVQSVLPRILEQLAAEGWRLAAVSGPQLYYFVRPLPVR